MLFSKLLYVQRTGIESGLLLHQFTPQSPLRQNMYFKIFLSAERSVRQTKLTNSMRKAIEGFTRGHKDWNIAYNAGVFNFGGLPEEKRRIFLSHVHIQSLKKKLDNETARQAQFLAVKLKLLDDFYQAKTWENLYRVAEYFKHIFELKNDLMDLAVFFNNLKSAVFNPLLPVNSIENKILNQQFLKILDPLINIIGIANNLSGLGWKEQFHEQIGRYLSQVYLTNQVNKSELSCLASFMVYLLNLKVADIREIKQNMSVINLVINLS